MKSARTQIISFLAAASPVRYGVVALVIATVCYVGFHIIPLVRRDVQLLREAYLIDETGTTMQGDLQHEIQESRDRFLRILLTSGDSIRQEEEMQAMRGVDAKVIQTQRDIAKSGIVSGIRQKEFQERWQQYIAHRDGLLTAALRADHQPPRSGELDLGEDKFQLAEQAIQDTQRDFQASYARNIREVSTSLEGALREFSASVLMRIAGLLLLIWLDWRRVSLEKQLAETTRSLHASQDRFRTAYDSAMVGMGIFKLDGTVVSVNRAGAQMLGYEREELIGRRVADFMAPECREDHLHTISRIPDSTERSYQAERRIIRKDGSAAWVRNSVTLLQPPGEEGHYFSITEEVTQQKEANDKLAYLANYDPVTNLPNRNSFQEQLILFLQSTRGTSDCIALLLLEIDSIDFLSGTFGHTVANEVLAELGANLALFRRDDEFIARLDDHVFAMLTRAAPYDEATLARGSDLRDVFRRAGETGKHRIPLSASIGIAYSSDGTSSSHAAPFNAGSGAETLLKFARAAMLEARSRGGDSIFLADPGLKQRAVQRHQIELALLNGLRQDEFRVVFQPQFQVATGKLIRFEALCRWNSRELGPIPPDRFIPIAEQTGLIMEIGRRILHDALSQAKTWTDSGRRIGVAVNISPMQFMRPDFTNLMTEVLTLTQFPPSLLELEITEGIFIRDLNLAVGRIRELQRLGLSIALDDFGTGYSSLSYLQKMPIDAVKLDRSFISDLTTDVATVSMVRSVLAMADALHLRVVTEGVETEEQLEILQSLGCDEAQGYLLGRPESAELALQRVLESPMQPMGMVVGTNARS